MTAGAIRRVPGPVVINDNTMMLSPYHVGEWESLQRTTAVCAMMIMIMMMMMIMPGSGERLSSVSCTRLTFLYVCLWSGPWLALQTCTGSRALTPQSISSS